MAELPVEGVFPDLDGATAWLNSAPLTPDGLRGQVVVVQFCTFSCVIPERAGPVKSVVGGGVRFSAVPGRRVGVRHPQSGSRRSARSAARTNGLDAGEDDAMLITARDGDHRGYGVIGFRLHECRRSAQASRGVRLPVIPSRGWAGMKRCGSGRAGSIKRATTPTSWWGS
jgi:hypothetical protein